LALVVATGDYSVESRALIHLKSIGDHQFSANITNAFVVGFGRGLPGFH
jgi:hypothetical protein